MGTIDMSREHTLSDAAARQRAEAIATSMDAEYGIEWKWAGSVISFVGRSGGKASGVKGALTLQPGRVRIQIDLPMLLSWFADPISDSVRGYLDTLSAP